MNVFKPDWTLDRNGLGDCFAPRSRPSDRTTLRCSDASRFDRLSQGPSRAFVSLTRNPDLAQSPPTRFEPTRKAVGDIVL